jgi:PadR family transcriptional regulator, regulatory protein PadR
MLRDFFLGFVKIHVLHHAAQEPVYGLALLDELRRHGYELGPSTLYPLLHGLEAAGYLAREDRVVGGKVRKYYAITDAGRVALAEARVKIAELVDEVLGYHGPGHLPEPSAHDEEGATDQ